MIINRLMKLTALQLAVLVTVFLRVFYSVAGALLTPFLRLDPELIQSNKLTENLMVRSEGWKYQVLGIWERFDTLWYIHIAGNFYDRPDAVVFYPLYPILIRALSYVFHSPLIAALLISTLAAFFWFWGLIKLGETEFDRVRARRMLLLAAVWPASFIFFAGYADSLVAALTVWSVYFGRKNKWVAAGALGLLAGATKAVGALVIVPLAVIAWRCRNPRSLWALLSIGGPISFMAYLHLSGRLLPSEAYPLYWRTEIAMPWTTLTDVLSRLFSEYDLLLRMNVLALVIVLVLILTARIPLDFRLYALACLGLFFMKKTDPLLQSSVRYIAAVFPLYMAANRLLGDRAQFAVAAIALGFVNLCFFWTFLEWGLAV